jgi:uncharacterized protein YkwD
MVNLRRTLAVLALAAAVAAGTLGALEHGVGTAAAAGDCTPGADWPAQRSDLAQQTVQLVNQHRASLGLRQLVVAPTLQASAEWKARHMAKYLYMAHNDPAPPVARDAAGRMAACGVSGAWGENIAYGYPTAQSVVTGWLNSAGHRANIENPTYAAIGSGAAVGSSGQIYWAQAFGTSTDGVPPAPAPPPAPPPAPAPQPPPPTTPPPTTPPPTTPKPPAPAPPGAPAPAPAPATPAAPATKAVSAAPNVVTLKGLNVTPNRPKAGEKLRSTVAVTKRGVRLQRGHVFCSARLNGQPLEVLSHRLRRGTAACVWRLPASAEGKTISAVMIVQQGRLRALAPFRITAS